MVIIPTSWDFERIRRETDVERITMSLPVSLLAMIYEASMVIPILEMRREMLQAEMVESTGARFSHYPPTKFNTHVNG
jgi:hypothetical protein